MPPYGRRLFGVGRISPTPFFTRTCTSPILRRRAMATDQRPEGDWRRNVRERRPVDVQSLRPDAAGLRCLCEGGKCRLRSLKTLLEVVQLPDANDSVAAGGRQPRPIGALGAQSHHGDGGA